MFDKMTAENNFHYPFVFLFARYNNNDNGKGRSISQRKPTDYKPFVVVNLFHTGSQS